MRVIDRRNKALGGQANDRALNKITKIGVHWDGVANGTIAGHENYWKNFHGWKNGGYHYFVDNDGVIHRNYNLEKITNGVGGHNSTTAHVCYGGNFSNPMNDKQKEAVKYVINELMLPHLPNAKTILGHNEFANAGGYNHSSNSCPGINMGDFRAFLKGGKASVPNKQKQASKSIEQLAQEVINGNYGSGDTRKKALGNQYQVVQNRVNEILLGTSTPQARVKTVDQLAKEVIGGKHGSGDARKRSLGSRYQEVQNRVNQILGAGGSNRKSIDTIAREVIDGKWGNDPERSRKLRNAGYDAKAVQRRVNQLL